MECEIVLPALDVFRTREVGKREYEALSRHLEGCRECAEELAQIKQLEAGLANLQLRAPHGILNWVLANSTDYYACVRTELGALWVGYNTRGMTMVRLSRRDRADFEAAYKARLGRQVRPGPLPRQYGKIIRQAARGKTPVLAPLDLSSLSAFERQVLMVLKRIPHGEVRPYGWLARQTGRPKAVRAVGQTLARNPLPLLLPCHRIVPAQRGVGNYIFGSDLKRRLLELEGVPLEELEQRTSLRV